MVHHVVIRLSGRCYMKGANDEYALHRQERRLNLLTFLGGSKVAKERLKSSNSTQFQRFSEI